MEPKHPLDVPLSTSSRERPSLDLAAGGIPSSSQVEVIGTQHRALPMDDGPLQGVLEFADVARPVVVLQHLLRFREKLEDSAAPFLAEALQVEAGERRISSCRLRRGGTMDGQAPDP